MSLFRSILNSTSPPHGYSEAYSSTSKRERELELPLYGSPPPSIPSPITKSIYKPSPDIVTDLHASTIRLEQGTQKGDDLLHLQRREQYLQQRLQELLDAQADGLLTGLSGKDNEEGDIRSGSSTPTARSTGTSGRGASRLGASEGLRSQSRAPRKLGLRQARREIYRTIRDLSRLKAEEDVYLEEDQQGDQSVLAQIDGWENKRTRIEREMSEIEASEGGDDVKTMQSEADKLGAEIQELEIRLAQMRTRHRRLLAEMEEVDNNVQSKLTSYKSSLAMLEKETRAFLDRPLDDSDQSPYAKLPPSRRTLEMAKEHYGDRLDHTERLRKIGQTERDALDDGAQVWKEVVETLGAFESQLKAEMVTLGRERDEEARNSKTCKILNQMDEVLALMETKLDLAQERDWKLLVCCIGAEVEAFKQGKQVLEGLLPPSESRTNGSYHDSTSTSHQPAPPRSSPSRRSRISSPPTRSETAHDSDDDPDPELLITHRQE